MAAFGKESPEKRMQMFAALLGSEIDKEPICPDPGQEGMTWRQILQEQFDADAAKERKRPMQLYRAPQVSTTGFEKRYLIPGVLVAGEPGGIYGTFKTLKTSCTCDLLFSVATGTNFLGHFPVAETGPVLLMSGESGLAPLQCIFQRIAAARDMRLEQAENLIVSPDLPRLSQPRDIRALGRIIKNDGLKVLALDPAYMMVDLADLSGIGERVRPLAELCESTGCTVLIVHHSRRRDLHLHHPSSLAEVVLGGFTEFAAQWILISRRRPFDMETAQHDLWMSFGGRAGHAGFWAVEVEEGKPDDPGGRVWNVVVERPASAQADAEARRALEDAVRQERRAAATLLRDRARTMKLLADYPQGETANLLRALLGFSGDRMNRVLTSLCESGVIEMTDVMADRRGARGYRLVRHSGSSGRTGQNSSGGPDRTSDF